MCCIGNWELVVKRDYFNKVAGGVRDQGRLDAHSEVVKIRTAVTVADQQQDSETANLQTVITLANQTLVTLLNATVAANYTAQLTALDTKYASDSSNVSTLCSTPQFVIVNPFAIHKLLVFCCIISVSVSVGMPPVVAKAEVSLHWYEHEHLIIVHSHR